MRLSRGRRGCRKEDELVFGEIRESQVQVLGRSMAKRGWPGGFVMMVFLAIAKQGESTGGSLM